MATTNVLFSNKYVRIGHNIHVEKLDRKQPSVCETFVVLFYMISFLHYCKGRTG